MANPAAGEILRASLFSWQPIVCTSTTRPAATEGTVIYETDTDRFLTFDGVAAWVLPKNIPAGLLGIATGVDQIGQNAIATGFTTEVALFSTPAVQTFAGRRYRIFGRLRFVLAGANLCYWNIRRGTNISGAIVAQGEVPGITRGSGENWPIEGFDLPGAQSSQQYALTVQMLTGSGTVKHPSMFAIESVAGNF